MTLSRVCRHFPDVTAALFITLYLYTALEKLKDQYGFFKALERSELIGPIAGFLSWAVPLSELVIVVLLIFPRTRISGLVAATLLIISFTVYIGVMIATASELPCTCGGIIQDLTWREHFVVNSSFMLLGIFSIWMVRKQKMTKNHPQTISKI